METIRIVNQRYVIYFIIFRVKVNRLEYKKIEREKDKYTIKKGIHKSSSKNQGIFKLPSIMSDFKH